MEYLIYLMLVLGFATGLPFKKTYSIETVKSAVKNKENSLFDTERNHDPGNHQRLRRATVRTRDRLWPRGILMYRWAPNIDKKSKRVLKEAMKHISERSCVRFRKAKSGNEDHVFFMSKPGCSSEIGRRGGSQKLTIGKGCNERMGVAVHELLHALGFYHEQARPDRDDYVEVRVQHVAKRYHKDFEKLNKTVINSRGYPYDYLSIMHYKEYTFSNTGDQTIVVKGQGKMLVLPIGQRKGMSNIDIAQLRDMYQCNQKQDNLETECQPGWIKHRTSCYNFVRNTKLQFDAATSHCNKLDSHLVHINTRQEDKFLKRYLSKNSPNIQRWRVGAMRVNGSFHWIGRDNKPIEMKYTSWKQGRPSKYSTIVLRKKSKSSTKFIWEGARLGSSKQHQKYTYAFICEKRSERRCLHGQHEDGRDYRGTLDHTINGLTCQTWTQQYPHQHNVIPHGQTLPNEDGIGQHNFCRNPSTLRRERPWCYTTKSRTEWEYCDIRTCNYV